MKKLITLFLIFLSTIAFSQDKTYTMAMDSFLSQVDKAPLTTNILYDRIFSFGDLDTNTSPPVSNEKKQKSNSNSQPDSTEKLENYLTN